MAKLSFNTRALAQVFRRFQTNLRQSEWASRAELEQHQQALTERLVRHAHAVVPFYRDRLAHLFRPDGSIDLAGWTDVPILTREQVVAHHDAMLTPDLPATYGQVTELTTTGTTGTPMRIASNGLNKIASKAALARVAQWWGLDTSRDLASVRLYIRGGGPQYPEGGQSRAWSFDNLDSRAFNLDHATPIDQQIDWLLRKKAPYLSTLPANASALAHAVTPDQAQALALEAILCYGETVLPHVREIVRERLHAPMVAIYSCQEVGFIAIQCPKTDSYHVMMENVLVEILRDDGMPAAPGEPGRVVLTGFYNYAMPFIRYAVGDVATPGPAFCPCGRSHQVIAHVDGRTRNAFRFRDGSRVWLRPIDFDIGPYVSCREYQLVQTDLETIELRYVPEPGEPAPDQAGLKTYLRAKTHPSVAVELVPVEHIPKGPGGKFTPYVSMVEP